ncbi:MULTISPECIES: hypothetical protein [Streptomyces]|uniref:hypothetical protein n=1 Tax=Streptomyces TaxID=1883 RepID=UPI00364BEC8C
MTTSGPRGALPAGQGRVLASVAVEVVLEEGRRVGDPALLVLGQLPLVRPESGSPSMSLWRGIRQWPAFEPLADEVIPGPVPVLKRDDSGRSHLL